MDAGMDGSVALGFAWWLVIGLRAHRLGEQPAPSSMPARRVARSFEYAASASSLLIRACRLGEQSDCSSMSPRGAARQFEHAESGSSLRHRACRDAERILVAKLPATQNIPCSRPLRFS